MKCRSFCHCTLIFDNKFFHNVSDPFWFPFSFHIFFARVLLRFAVVVWCCFLLVSSLVSLRILPHLRSGGKRVLPILFKIGFCCPVTNRYLVCWQLAVQLICYTRSGRYLLFIATFYCRYLCDANRDGGHIEYPRLTTTSICLNFLLARKSL